MKARQWIGMGTLAFVANLFFVTPATTKTEDSIRVKVTVLIASDQGTDMNLVNDEVRDQLIRLFSYSSYEEVAVQAVELPRSQRVKVDLPSGYELLLTYQGVEAPKINVQALIRKEAKQYVSTVLAMPEAGAVFLGGPPVENGVLIIVLETGF